MHGVVKYNKQVNFSELVTPHTTVKCAIIMERIIIGMVDQLHYTECTTPKVFRNGEIQMNC